MSKCRKVENGDIFVRKDGATYRLITGIYGEHELITFRQYWSSTQSWYKDSPFPFIYSVSSTKRWGRYITDEEFKNYEGQYPQDIPLED